MKRSLNTLAILAIAAITMPAFAATQTATINVTASVTSVCTISALPVAFGAYDPVVANNTGGADKFANGSVTVACTKGAPNVWIDLNAGGNSASAVGTTRAMSSGTDFLSYELYKNNPNPGPGTVWSTGNGTGGLSYTSLSKAATTITVYGRAPKGQDVTAGAYSDAVTATINY